MRVRVSRRTIWYMAAVPVVSMGACVSWAILGETEPARGARQPGPAYVPAVAPKRPVSAPVAHVASASASRWSRDDENTARDRSAPTSKREAALRRLSVRTPEIGARVALELLRLRDGGSLEREALRVVAHAGDASACPEILELLERTQDAETALACGTALDARGPLDATDLSRAMSRASLPEARVVLLRTLAQAQPPEVAQVAVEQALRTDPSPLVRAEALGSVDATRISSIADAIVADPSLRQAAPRTLARVPGSEVDRVLEESFRAETDTATLKALAQALARRSEEARGALLEVARATSERYSIASAALASFQGPNRGRNP